MTAGAKSRARSTSTGMLALALLLGGAGCTPGPRVEGSLSTLIGLRYDEARVFRTDDEVAVHFVAVAVAEDGEDPGEVVDGAEPPAAAENTVLQVSARLAGLELVPGAALDVDLAEPMEGSGALRGTVGRAVLDEPPRAFPRIARGRLQLAGSEVLESGTRLSGSFSVTFVNGVGFAAGHTAYATFEAIVP